MLRLQYELAISCIKSGESWTLHCWNEHTAQLEHVHMLLLSLACYYLAASANNANNNNKQGFPGIGHLVSNLLLTPNAVYSDVMLRILTFVVNGTCHNCTVDTLGF